MKLGPGDFNGERLQLAREFRALTQKEVASRVSASHVLVSYYEGGKRKNPSQDLVEAFGSVLGFEPQFFYSRGLSPGDWQCNFRHRRAATERIKRQVRAHALLVGLIVERLADLISFPRFNVPNFPANSREDIEAAAEETRRHWGLESSGPIDNISRTLEHAGVLVAADMVETRKVDAFSGYGPVSVIFLNRAIGSSSRCNFDVAHETGHLVMHRGIETGSAETEAEADLFASNFLMPRSSFAADFVQETLSWTHIWSLKQAWKVSAAAIVRRAYDLKLMNADKYRNAQKYLSFKKYRTSGEPYEPEYQAPELLPNAIKFLSEQDPSALLEISKSIGLPAGTFREVISFDLPPSLGLIHFPSLATQR